jgi:predicted nucleotidyltransferase
MNLSEHSKAYFALLEALQDMFVRPIDLVEIKAINNPYLMESINENRSSIYAA